MNRKHTTLFSMLLALLTAAPCFAQGEGQHAAELSKVVRLNRAPVSKEALQIHLPRPVGHQAAQWTHGAGAGAA